jgi:LysM repeat protein
MSSRYTIQRGDTLGRIALRFYRSAAKYPLIATANRIANPDALKVGQVLVIPDAPVKEPQPGKGNSTKPVAAAIDPVRTLSERRLAGLHPVVVERAKALLDAARGAGLAVMVTQGLRTWKEQDALYRKGRTSPPIGKRYIVTNAKGGYSWHNFGLAFDVLLLDALGKGDWNTRHPGWRILGELGKKAGLEWGGDWKTPKDFAHFQYTGGITLATCRHCGERAISDVWKLVKYAP